MKKVSLVIYCLLAINVAYAVEAICEYSESDVTPMGSVWTYTYTYSTSNGDCCSPTAGAAHSEYNVYYFNGMTSSGSSYISSSTAAAGNPACSSPANVE